MKLFALLINVAGILKPANELSGYTDGQLNGRRPFLASTDATVIDYQDITSLENWNLFGQLALNFTRTRFAVRDALVAMIGADYSGWPTLTPAQKTIAATWMVAPYALRLQVHSEEDDKLAWENVLQCTLDDRRVQVEAMRKTIGNELRIGTITKADAEQFWNDTDELLSRYIYADGRGFHDWLTSPTGFAAKTYYTQQRYNKLYDMLFNYNY
jgi:hypothetical protein